MELNPNYSMKTKSFPLFAFYFLLLLVLTLQTFGQERPWTGGRGGATNAETLYATAANITNPEVQRWLAGFANELRAANIYSNLADAMFFQPQFNPTNKLSFFRRSLQSSNDVYYKWGVRLTNGISMVQVTNLPNCQTGTVVIVWHVPGLYPGIQDGNEPGRFLGGMFSGDGLQGYYVGANGAYNSQFRVRQGGRENATGSDGKNACVIPWSIFNYGNSGNSASQNQFTVGDKMVNALCYDGSSLSGYQNFWPAQIDYLNPSFATNYAVQGIQVSVPLTTLRIGVDAISTNAIGTAKSDCLEALVFNKVLNFDEYAAVWRAVRWLDPDSKDWRIAGDSTISHNGILPASGTNSIAIQLKAALDVDSTVLNVFDFSAAGDSYSGWGQFPGNLNNNAYITNLFIVSDKFKAKGKVSEVRFTMLNGLNDMYSGKTPMDTLSNAFFCNATCGSNGVIFWPSTAWETCSNGATMPWTFNSGSSESNRLIFNRLMITNAWKFDRLVRVDLLRNQTIMNTNAGFTIDGTHLGGTNGFLINQRAVTMYRDLSYIPPVPVTINTNTATMGATGWTNNTEVDMNVVGFTGTTVTQTFPEGTTASLGTIATGVTIPVQPGGKLVGTSCAATYIHAASSK